MIDYASLGFKAGLEIHQQLETHKLFCQCPSIVRDGTPDIHLRRKLRLVSGESGEIDEAALFEQKKEKEFMYEACSTSCCLVELDEEPVSLPNPEALRVALQVALLLHARIVDEVQFMRKTVIDGSNVSGFQRTALVAMDGYLDTSKGRISIPTICLEEEAAKKIEATKEYAKYRLDRLGIPLLEIATGPELKDPEHVKEVAEKLGLLLRSTGKVKRGIGTIRQDVNVSIQGKDRVEIKGFQDLRSIPKVIEYEVERQVAEHKAGKHVKHVRKAEPDLTTSYLRPMPGAARMYPETDVPTIPITKEILSSIELPELIEDQAKDLEKLGIDSKLAIKIVKEGKAETFRELSSKLKNLKLTFIVDTFNSLPSALNKDFSIDEKEATEERIVALLYLVNENKVPKNQMAQALAAIVKGTFKESDYEGVSEKELETAIKEIIKKQPGLNEGAYMGLIMKHFKGRVDGRKAMDGLKKSLDAKP